MLYILWVGGVSTITTGMEEVPWLSDSFKVSQQMEMRLEAVLIGRVEKSRAAPSSVSGWKCHALLTRMQLLLQRLRCTYPSERWWIITNSTMQALYFFWYYNSTMFRNKHIIQSSSLCVKSKLDLSMPSQRRADTSCRSTFLKQENGKLNRASVRGPPIRKIWIRYRNIFVWKWYK